MNTRRRRLGLLAGLGLGWGLGAVLAPASETAAMSGTNLVAMIARFPEDRPRPGASGHIPAYIVPTPLRAPAPTSPVRHALALDDSDAPRRSGGVPAGLGANPIPPVEAPRPRRAWLTAEADEGDGSGRRPPVAGRGWLAATVSQLAVDPAVDDTGMRAAWEKLFTMDDNAEDAQRDLDFSWSLGQWREETRASGAERYVPPGLTDPFTDPTARASDAFNPWRGNAGESPDESIEDRFRLPAAFRPADHDR